MSIRGSHNPKRIALASGVLVLALTPGILAACSPSPAPPAAQAGAGAAGGAEVGAGSAQGGSGGSDDPLAGRSYEVVEPSGYDGSAPTPLVVMIHQMWADENAAEWMDEYLGITAEADARGILVAIPQATYDDTLGAYMWNVNESCCAFFGQRPDDVGFIMAMIDEIQTTHNIDERQIYSIGQSNGGFMAHQLACDHAEVFAGLAALSGAVDARHCMPSEPVSVIHFHGTSDDLVPFEGGTPFDVVTAEPTVSASETVATWAAKNGCAETPDAPISVDLVPNMPGAETTHIAYGGCSDNSAAELYAVADAEHLPEFDERWAPLVFDFLMAHPKALGASE
jgi:polyhydroxybutyrate depolymerase